MARKYSNPIPPSGDGQKPTFRCYAWNLVNDEGSPIALRLIVASSEEEARALMTREGAKGPDGPLDVLYPGDMIDFFKIR